MNQDQVVHKKTLSLIQVLATTGLVEESQTHPNTSSTVDKIKATHIDLNVNEINVVDKIDLHKQTREVIYRNLLRHKQMRKN